MRQWGRKPRMRCAKLVPWMGGGHVNASALEPSPAPLSGDMGIPPTSSMTPLKPRYHGFMGTVSSPASNRRRLSTCSAGGEEAPNERGFPHLHPAGPCSRASHALSIGQCIPSRRRLRRHAAKPRPGSVLDQDRASHSPPPPKKIALAQCPRGRGWGWRWTIPCRCLQRR